MYTGKFFNLIKTIRQTGRCHSGIQVGIWMTLKNAAVQCDQLLRLAMRHLSTTPRVFAACACLAVLSGCAGTRTDTVTAVNSEVVVTPSDIDRLTGASWIGTLTYLDYTSKERTSIK